MRVVNWRRWSAVIVLALNPAMSTPAWAGDHVHPPKAPMASSIGPALISGFVLPYRTRSSLYGYRDFAYGRGPLNDLGRGTSTGFRGYGVLGQPGIRSGDGPDLAHRLVRQTAALSLAHARIPVRIWPRYAYGR